MQIDISKSTTLAYACGYELQTIALEGDETFNEGLFTIEQNTKTVTFGTLDTELAGSTINFEVKESYQAGGQTYIFNYPVSIVLEIKPILPDCPIPTIEDRSVNYVIGGTLELISG